MHCNMFVTCVKCITFPICTTKECVLIFKLNAIVMKHSLRQNLTSFCHAIICMKLISNKNYSTHTKDMINGCHTKRSTNQGNVFGKNCSDIR